MKIEQTLTFFIFTTHKLTREKLIPQKWSLAEHVKFKVNVICKECMRKTCIIVVKTKESYTGDYLVILQK